MWQLPFYRLSLWHYGLALRVLAATGHAKARAWVEGRKHWRSAVQAWREAHPQARPVWMHCASLGEFEQGRPVLEALRQRYPQLPIVLSFFSPSGYEVQQDYRGADLVFYLPEDGPANAKDLVALLQPSLALFVKYEFWYHHILALNQAQIPLWLVSGIFRQSQPFFQWYGGLHRRMLSGFQKLFVQNEESLQLLQGLGLSHVVLSGDTRFDRVLRLPREPFASPAIEMWLGDRPCLVAGSTWPADEALLSRVLDALPGWALLLVPHHVDAASTAATKALFPQATLYTEMSASTPSNAQVLIVNAVGMLSKLYRLGSLAYVGGGLAKTGIHNVLEPAVYGLPVLHGPYYAKYAEAVDLLAAGGSLVVDDEASLRAGLAQLQQPSVMDTMGGKAREFVRSRAGATAVIVAEAERLFGDV